MRKTLSVGNLPADLNPGAIARLFSQVGTVLHAELITPIGTPRRNGALVIIEMNEADDATRALRELNGQEFRGARLTVRPATAAEETTAGHPRMFGTMNMADDPDPPTDV